MNISKMLQNWWSSKRDNERMTAPNHAQPANAAITSRFIWTESTEGRAFVKTLAKDIVAEVTPEELLLFDELVQEYFDDPTPPDLSTRGSDDPLGMDLGELLAETPAIMAMVMSWLAFLSTYTQKKQGDVAEQKAELRRLLSYEDGLQQLFYRMPPHHARYSDALVYQQRLTENITQAKRLGDTSERRSERTEIIDQLNPLALHVVGQSFNALCGMVNGLTEVEMQHMKQELVKTAQDFGIREMEKAEQIADTMTTVVQSVLWGEKDETDS